jgi:hypothetical protein
VPPDDATVGVFVISLAPEEAHGVLFRKAGNEDPLNGFLNVVADSP